MEMFRFRKDIPFMSYGRLTTTISLATFVLAVFFIATKGLNLGVDFTGGTVMEVHYAQPADMNKVRAELTEIGFHDALAQHFGSSHDVLIQLPIKQNSTGSKLSEEVLAKGVQVYWDAGYQLHVHVNGDGGMDSALGALESAQQRKPRFDHRFMMHHIGFHTNAQSLRMATLGAHASVNPYFIFALADSYASLGLGPERASQIVRCGSLLRSGMKISFHSDFMMAPTEPLLLAWCAATRTTKSGNVVSPEERLNLMQALRGITIDAAFALKMDHEIGSIVVGKKADFTILEDDPFEMGVDRLKDVRVSGTIFEGQVHRLAHSVASVLAKTSPGTAAPTSVNLFQTETPSNPIRKKAKGRYRPVASYCCDGSGDPCVFLRQLTTWMTPQSAVYNGPSALT